MRLIEIPSRRSLGGFDMRYLLMLGIAIGATGEPTVEVGQAPNPKEAMLEATETPFGTNRRRLCDSCSGDDAHCDCNCACECDDGRLASSSLRAPPWPWPSCC